MKMEYHNAVLLNETVDGLDIKENGVYVDVTFGGGGHSREILKRLGPKGRLIAFDQDQDALINIIDDERFLLINENFRYIKQFLRFHGVKQVDGILADFGVSSHQFDMTNRGFSIRFDSELDMRMNQNDKLSAYHVINEYEEEQLRKVLFEYGELRQAPAIARTIVSIRKTEPIKTSGQFKEVVKRFLPPRKENKVLAQIYQAIRIEVNQELEVLKEFLLQTPQVIRKGGRLSVISYHSLEDRMVKRFFKSGNLQGKEVKDHFGRLLTPWGKITRRPIQASEEEIEVNPRARSAKLRAAKRIEIEYK